MKGLKKLLVGGERMSKPSKFFNLWLFGLPCSGKTTLAEKLMDNFSRDRVIHLDGDEIRKTISKDLDFSYESREINIRRVIELCNFLNYKKYSTVVSVITPLNKYREIICKELQSGVHLIYIDATIEQCRSRDVKGMYKLANDSKIKDFTGIGSNFEIPKNYDLRVDTNRNNINESLQIIKDYLKTNQVPW